MQRKRKKKEGCWFCREKRDEKSGRFIGAAILARIYFHGSPLNSVEIYACPVCGKSVDPPPSLPFQKKVEKTIKELERGRKSVTRMIVKEIAITRNWLSQNFLNFLKRKGVRIEVI